MALIVAVLALALGAAKPSTEGSAALSEAKRMMRVPKYTAAIEALARALDDPELARRERIEALELRAAAHMARSDPAQAEAAFGALLELAPEHQLAAGVSPKIRDVFERARKNRRRPPRIETVTATIVRDRVDFTAKLDDPDHAAARVAVSTRADGGSFSAARMIGDGGTYTATVAVAKGTTRIEWYVEVFDLAKRTAARSGSAESPSAILLSRAPPPPPVVEKIIVREPPPPIPITVTRPIEEEESVFSRWWFWTIVGVAVVGAGAGTYVIATRSDSPDVAGNLPLIRLP